MSSEENKSQPLGILEQYGVLRPVKITDISISGLSPKQQINIFDSVTGEIFSVIHDGGGYGHVIPKEDKSEDIPRKKENTTVTPFAFGDGHTPGSWGIPVRVLSEANEQMRKINSYKGGACYGVGVPDHLKKGFMDHDEKFEYDEEMELRMKEDDNKSMDNVNHPPHYTKHPSGVEAIDVCEHMSFNLGNAMKYIWRADHKGRSIEDLQKAAWYVNREIERLTKGSENNGDE